MMKKYIDHINKRFENWDRQDVLSTLRILISYLIRGCYHRLFFKKSKGLVLIGRGATFRYSKHLTAGSDLIVEEYAELNCLSSENITLGNRVTIGRFAVIRPSNSYGGPIGKGLKIGHNSNIGAYNYVGCSGYIEIGDNVMLGPRVGLFAENHNFENADIPIKDQGVTLKFIKIESNCWIGTNSVILAGVTIGEGSVIAAGSVVTKDIPPYSIAAGVPAKVLKSRK